MQYDGLSVDDEDLNFSSGDTHRERESHTQGRTRDDVNMIESISGSLDLEQGNAYVSIRQV